MSTRTVFWRIDVELGADASIEDYARSAAASCRRMDLDDSGGASVFHVAVAGSEAAHLLELAAERSVQVDLGDLSASHEHRLADTETASEVLS